MINYIISSSLCSGLLLLTYWLLLLPEKLYRFNRFYLIFSLIFSLLIPIWSIHFPYKKPNSSNHQIIFYGNSIMGASMKLQDDKKLMKTSDNILSTHELFYKQISIWDTVLIISFIITFVLTFRFIRNLYLIVFEIRKNSIIILNNIKIVLLDKKITPHSFLNYIFIYKSDYVNNLTEPQILCHEEAHVNQLHSLDVIFIEILQVICWFNPFLSLYRKAIQLNHEFLADEVVLKNNYDTASYQYLVLAKLNPPTSILLTSQFNYLHTKKRFIMMTKNTSGKTAFYKILALCPVLICALFLFSSARGRNNTLFKGPKLTTNNLSYLQSNAFGDFSWGKILAFNNSNRKGPVTEENILIKDTPHSAAKNRNHLTKERGDNHRIIDTSKNTFSTNSSAPINIDTNKKTFSTQSVIHDNSKTKNTFSTAAGKQNSGSSDLVDFTNKLILIRGKEATSDQLSSLSLEKIKFIKPFNGTDDLGNGTFEKIYGEKAKNGGLWIVLKD